MGLGLGLGEKGPGRHSQSLALPARAMQGGKRSPSSILVG